MSVPVDWAPAARWRSSEQDYTQRRSADLTIQISTADDGGPGALAAGVQELKQKHGPPLPDEANTSLRSVLRSGTSPRTRARKL